MNGDNPTLHRFFERTWAFVRTVPSGRVVTYGQVADAVSPPEGIAVAAYRREGARLVGGAMAACPPDVPWHRVVNARGRLSAHAVADRQRQHLLLEGVDVVAGQLDLAAVQWHGPGQPAGSPQQSLF